MTVCENVQMVYVSKHRTSFNPWLPVDRLYRDEEFIAPFAESVAVNQVLFAILESAQKREPVAVSY